MDAVSSSPSSMLLPESVLVEFDEPPTSASPDPPSLETTDSDFDPNDSELGPQNS